MKPTQQDIVDLAREAGGGLSTVAEPLNHPWKFSQTELERFVALLLERYGAGGGEPVVAAVFDALLGRPVLVEDAPMLAPGQELYTLPSPTDLRAEYLRGLEDAAKIAKGPTGGAQQSNEWWHGFRTARQQITDAIEALKGKQ